MAKVTRYKRVPLNVAGGSNETRSRSVSVARLVNWYPEATQAGVSDATLMPWPGITRIADITDYESAYTDRGMHVFKGITYLVKGFHLYRLNADFTVTQIGVIAGTDYCGMADNGIQMVICNGSTPYSYDGTTLSLLTDITFNPSSVAYDSGQFIFDTDGQQFAVSDPFSTTVRGDSYASPVISPDAFTAPYAFGQVVYMFGADSIEPWAADGGATPPYSIAQQGIIERIGCSAQHGITNTTDFMYFIHRSGTPYRVRGFNAQGFGTAGVIAKFQDYDCAQYRARSFAHDGQQFVLFDFYANNATWVYAETTDTWLQIDSGRSGDRWQAGSGFYNYGQLIFTDNTLPYIYKLDFTNFVNDWGPVTREKTFEFVAGERLGTVRGVYEMSRVVFGVEAGVGLLEGQGEVPLLGVQFTTDGKTWSQEIFVELGRSGEFSRQVEVPFMLQFQQLSIRTRLYDPIGFAFFSAALDVREAGY